MHLSRFFRRGIVLVALLALAMPLAALADGGKRGNDRRNDDRVFYATNTAGKLLKFDSDNPRKLRSKQITGLPMGVSIKGIDFRPASGDLYALGSDRVVYRLNPNTAIAVPEGKSFDLMPSILSGNFNGFDFNPTVDKITAFATRPTVTELYAYDVGASPDKLWIQRPANAGTLIMPQSTGLNLSGNVGFDIAGKENQGWLAGARDGRRSSSLYRLDINTGRTKQVGRIGDGSHTITGLAAVQDQ